MLTIFLVIIGGAFVICNYFLVASILQSRVLYRIFHQRGEIIVCGNILKLAGSGGMLPQEKFEIYDL